MWLLVRAIRPSPPPIGAVLARLDVPGRAVAAAPAVTAGSPVGARIEELIVGALDRFDLLGAD
ncbi:MAG TPA: hypothetical protein VIL36_15695, partial [Acidimicrobiales bacterium]